MSKPGERAEALVREFQALGDWERVYERLITLGKEMTPLPEDRKDPRFLVRGCVSQVWLIPRFEEGRVFFQADSDALITRGIVALLLKVYSSATPEEILACKPEFIKEIGLARHLSANRANGLSAMLKQISLYALAFQQQKESP